MAYFNEDNVTGQMCIGVAKQAGYESLDCTMALYLVAKTTDAVTDRPGSDEDINVHNTTGDDVDPDAKVMDFDMWDDFDNWDLWS